LQLGLAALAGLAATAYLVQSDRRQLQGPSEGATELTAVRAGAGRAVPAPPVPRPGVIAAGAWAPEPARGSASAAGGERALRVALDRFAFANLPTIDRCLGRGPGVRRPYMALVDFRRVDDRLVTEGVRLDEPRRPGGSAGQQTIERCLALLVGRELSVPSESGATPERLQRVVSIPLPDPT
jgi:hypothetical protein